MNTGFHLLPATASVGSRQPRPLVAGAHAVDGYGRARRGGAHRRVFHSLPTRALRADRTHAPTTGRRVEIAWTVIPLLIFLGIFAWAAHDYMQLYRVPPDAMPVFVVAKQWMWKLQHANGQREINELHVPLGQPVRLVMTSQDVIHSFFVPAFRIKQDVVPGRYTTIWFTPTKLGEFHLFCAEYCGTDHSRMRGRIVVMPPSRFRALAAGTASAQPGIAERGFELFRQLWLQRLP